MELNSKETKLTIVIDGDSAQDFLAAGVEDIVDFFLPEKFGVKKEDIVSCGFHRFDKEELVTYRSKHNYARDNK